MNIFVAKLSSETTSEDLENLFAHYGEVAYAKIIFDRETGNSKRYGFVEMPNEPEAYEAISELNESELQGSTIVVKKSAPREGGGRDDRGGYRREGGNRGGGGGYRREGGYRRDGGNRDFNRDGGNRDFNRRSDRRY